MKLPSKIIATALFGAFALTASPAAHAQINVNVAPPSWGPAVPAGAQYYYIPETNGFYDVRSREYVVSRNGQWYRTNELAGYNPRDFHPVVVDYVGAQPWDRYDEYRNRYPRTGYPPRGGNPSNGSLPPGQANKQGYRGNPSTGGLPPGQAKKMNRDRYDDRGRYDDRDRSRDVIPGIPLPLPGGRYPDDRRRDDDRRDDDRRRDDRRYDDRRRDDHRDDRRYDDRRRDDRRDNRRDDDDDDDHGKGKDKGKGHDKGHDRD